MRPFLVSLILTSFVACGGKNTDSGTDADSGANADVDSAFAPTEGVWVWSGVSYVSDGCNFEAEFPLAILEAFRWNVTPGEAGTFVIEGVGFDPIACTLTGQDFSCDLSFSAELTEWPEGSSNTGDPDAVNVLTGTAGGTFSDAQTATGLLEGTIVCEGPDCGAYLADANIESPCTSELAGDFLFAD